MGDDPPRLEPGRPGDPPTDDPTGGRGLTRRLAVGLPVAAFVGLLVGIPVAVAVGDWRVVVSCVAAAVVVVGLALAITEDGRVQRRIDGRGPVRRRRPRGGPPPD